MKRIGFGQVEPNHLSAKRTGQIYAQLPAQADLKLLENGMFVKYDYANNQVNLTGDGEWMMVLNEVKLYDNDFRYYGANNGLYAGYAMEAKNFMNGEIVPRVWKTNVGDIYTTNCLVAAGTAGEETDMGEIALNDVLSPNAQGYLAKDGEGSIEFKVVKVYTMPDGQEGVKLQRIK
jgi:hypothetical protein